MVMLIVCVLSVVAASSAADHRGALPHHLPERELAGGHRRRGGGRGPGHERAAQARRPGPSASVRRHRLDRAHQPHRQTYPNYGPRLSRPGKLPYTWPPTPARATPSCRPASSWTCPAAAAPRHQLSPSRPPTPTTPSSPSSTTPPCATRTAWTARAGGTASARWASPGSAARPAQPREARQPPAPLLVLHRLAHGPGRRQPRRPRAWWRSSPSRRPTSATP